MAGFILEADEHLHSANRNLVSVAEALKAGRLDPRAVRELFRSLHTIKGLASMVGAGPVVDLSHEMEGILRTADRAGGRISETALTLLVKGTEVIDERIKSIPKVGVAGLAKAPARLLEELIHFQISEQQLPKASVDRELELPQEMIRSLSASDREQALQGIAAGQNLILIDFEPSVENMAAGLNITSIRERVGKVAEMIKVTPHSAAGSATGIAF
ncbi:MAG: Hpt domain-containing protein, partial [Bdellovibrionota bacterium]